MNKIINITFIILCIFIIFYTLSFKNKKIFLKETENNIGNIICKYFYLMGRSWYNRETFVWKEFKENFNNDFYKNLPDKVDPPANIDLPDFDYNKIFPNHDIESTWCCNEPIVLEFWTKMKPYIHKILDDTLKKSDLYTYQKNPIIHFRCSDVPFNKHFHYHFQKYSFFKNALKNENEVDILSCNDHLSNENNKKACGEYIKLLSKELNDIKVNLKCRHYFEDFAAMFYAPKVISTGSSMSFFAGFFGKGDFITGGHFVEGFETEENKKINILHSEVSDYHNINEVHEKLKL